VAADIRHPYFARFFDRLSRAMETEVGKYRDQMLAGLSGCVVEIGAGNGINFRHYPPSVEEVIALEPEPYLRDRAQRAAEAAAVKVTVRSGTADELDLPDASADAVVSSLVLCSVPDQSAALGELRRVLRPGGELRFLEHVRAPGRRARVQSLFDATVWPRLAGGCHCARDTVAAISSSGFDVQEVRRADYGPRWMITQPHVLGRAVR
jgi:ubiquinone/menaquinone biosynthesis C-methylase UbiE